MEQTGIGQVPEGGCSKVQHAFVWISTATALWVELLIRGKLSILDFQSTYSSQRMYLRLIDDMSLFSKSTSSSSWLMLLLMSNLSLKALFFNFLQKIYGLVESWTNKR